MTQKIAITAISSVSSLGHTTDEIWKNYLSCNHFLSFENIGNKEVWVSKLSEKSKKHILELRQSDQKYKNLDDSVLFAIATARQAIAKAGWRTADNFGINIGSSRGATQLFEQQYKKFLETGKAQTLTSPTTTLGNISSWVAHDLQTNGPEISHSITCSTSLHAMLNGIAWLQSGMINKFLVGGSEAPLTDFTIAQMQALKIYSRDNNTEKYPCLAADISKNQNHMVLGEGAAMCCLEIGTPKNAIAYISGIGYATEILENSTSISTDAKCFQKSMRMALGNCSAEDIDAIVMHTPGTIKGDMSEFNAIDAVFNTRKPLLTCNKWKLGHTLGNSGMLSVEMAVLMLQNQIFIGIPYLSSENIEMKLSKILVNSVGFGGNAVSVLISL